jgi:hypothetical protein
VWDLSTHTHMHIHTGTSSVNYTDSHTQINTPGQERGKQAQQFAKDRHLCELLCYISGPINQSGLEGLLQLCDCNWNYLPQGLFFTFKVRRQALVF